MDIKYGKMWGSCCTNEVKGVYGVGFWKSIQLVWGDFVKNKKVKVGDGANIYFWYDTWCVDSALKYIYPNLFRIARDKKAAVAESYKISNNMLQWNVDFNRDVQDWEVGEVIKGKLGFSLRYGS